MDMDTLRSYQVDGVNRGWLKRLLNTIQTPKCGGVELLATMQQGRKQWKR